MGLPGLASMYAFLSRSIRWSLLQAIGPSCVAMHTFVARPAQGCTGANASLRRHCACKNDTDTRMMLAYMHTYVHIFTHTTPTPHAHVYEQMYFCRQIYDKEQKHTCVYRLAPCCPPGKRHRAAAAIPGRQRGPHAHTQSALPARARTGSRPRCQTQCTQQTPRQPLYLLQG